MGAQETPRCELVLQAPKGKFRVVGVDTFDGNDWVEKDFETRQLAVDHVRERVIGKQMLVMYIYDDEGRNIGKGGTY